MKKSFLVIAASVLLCSCQSEKSYTITGTLDIPAQVQYGDTVIDVPSFNDTWVYLLDLDQVVVDSALIENNSFTFEGKIKAKDAYYAYLLSQVANPSLIVIEPGDIDVYISPEVSVSGTPSNDCITDIEAALSNLNNDTYAMLEDLAQNYSAKGIDISEAIQDSIGTEYRKAMIALLDSAYATNKDNLGGAYVVLLRLMDSETVDAFESALQDYPDNIRDNQLFQITLQQMRQYEQMEQESGLEDLDSTMFAPAEELTSK